jgi:hypothetical protein
VVVDIPFGSKFCYSGRVDSQYRCPTVDELSPTSSSHYPTTVLLKNEDVKIDIINLRMTGEGRHNKHENENGDEEEEEEDSGNNSGNDNTGDSTRALTAAAKAAFGTFELQVALIQLGDYQASDLTCCWEVEYGTCDPREEVGNDSVLVRKKEEGSKRSARRPTDPFVLFPVEIC